MKNAQAKIDALLEVLIERTHDELVAIGKVTVVPEAREQIEWLIKMSNLNTQRQEKVGKLPGPQAKASEEEISNKDLVAQLKAGRDPDNFPRRGPRRGKRESVSTPIEQVPDVVTCAVHEGVVCVTSTVDGFVGTRCPECAKEPEAAAGFVSLKALL